MLWFTVHILSCVNYVFIPMVHIIIKIFMFQKLLLNKKPILQSRYSGLREIRAKFPIG